MNRIKPNQTQLEPTQNRIGRTPDGFEGAKRAALADGRNPKRGRDGARRAAVRLARRAPGLAVLRGGGTRLTWQKKKLRLLARTARAEWGGFPNPDSSGLGCPGSFGGISCR